MSNFSLTNDFIFRYIFGSETNADLLLSLVNSVLEAKRQNAVAGIQPANPFLPVNEQTQREGILDVHAVDPDGKQFDIEIQVRSQKAYVKRSLYYLTRMYGFQLCRADKYELLEPCISINILDFDLFPEEIAFHHFFTFREYDNHELELSRDISVHYLELPKLLKLINSQQPVQEPSAPSEASLNMIEKWLYLIKEIDNPEDAMVQTIINTTPELHRTKEEYQRFMTDVKLRWEAESHEKWLHDQAQYQYEAMEEGKALGKALGKAEGLAEGEAKGIQETAKKMLQSGLEISLISAITSLSPEEILKLQE